MEAMDDEDIGATTIDSFTNLSEAEKRRLRRRQKILGNQGARLQRILSDDSNSLTQVSRSRSWKTHRLFLGVADAGVGSGDKPEDFGIDEDISDFGTTPATSYSEIFGEKSSKVSTISTSSFESEVKTSPVQTKPKDEPKRKDPPNLSAILKELSSESGLNLTNQESTTSTEEPRLGVQSDGTVILPKISYRFGRILIVLLALFLSICNAKQYLITFISWEIAFYFLNGLPPLPPPNMLMVLAAVMGIKDQQLQRMKKIVHFINSVFIDFSIYLTFVMLPHIVSSLIKNRSE